MKSPARVLAAVDFSGDARRAAARAALIAREQGAQLDFLHILSPSSLASLRELLRAKPASEAAVLAAVGERLESLAAEVMGEAGLRARTRVEVGKVLEGIAAASGRSDLLVLGARGWNPLRDRILGTTAERLLGKCLRPVLVSRRPPRGPYARVVVATDFSADSIAALEWALGLAPAAQVTLVHAFGVPFEGKLRYAGVEEAKLREYRAHARREALAQMRAMLSTKPREFGRLTHAVAYGHAPQMILGKARLLRADLIAIGKHGKSLAEDLLLGSVTRHVLSDAKCDVLVVQEPPAR